ncbi:hypothetical protein [Deinococcus fonticola]|uniref:hypothetical protein n=1 Tax=Deinococcus fonticola TaxID=2528713 RepID=UPI001F109BE0|nr:hypothetical protein [Deinococcus fonticola]
MNDTLSALAARPIQTHGDALELLDELSLHLYQLLAERDYDPATIPEVLALTLGPRGSYSTLPQTLHYACTRLKPDLDRTEEEISNLSGRVLATYR